MNSAPSVWVRWLRFNGAGIFGVGVQLAALQLLIRAFGVNYLTATAFSVEAAVLHNFLWHERLTWGNRVRLAPQGTLGRLLRFHLGNGLISIGGNLLLMRWMVGKASFPVLPSNLAAIGVCSTLNFLVCDYFVYRTPRPSKH